MKRSDRNVAAAALELDVLIEEQGWETAVPDAESLCRSAAVATWTLVASADAQRPGQATEACIVLASDARVRMLNRDFRGRDEPTDVLSFPAFEPDVLAAAGAEGPPPILGDVIVALETSLADAARDGKPIAHHLRHLVVHGILHLLGYDHEADDDAAEMEGLEIRILAGFGTGNPYQGSDDV
jgi:probable rRNA maturation factor